MDYIEEQPTGVYIRIDRQYHIIEINSDRFITDKTGWVKIDEGFGDKYNHAQGNYLDKPLIDEYGRYNYAVVDGRIVEIPDAQKPAYQPYTYAQLVEQKIRQRYTVSDELALLRQRDTKPDEFAEYNTFCEVCKHQAQIELGL